MAQAHFEFSPAIDISPQATAGNGDRPWATQARSAAATQDPTAFEIGWDHAHHRITPPLRHLHDHNPVRQGWDAGRATFGTRTLAATAAVQQWLALRLQAWQHGQLFEGVQVNPHFLTRIDAQACPVSRQVLSGDPAASVTRLNQAAAYAAGNLAVLSQQVIAARGAADWQQSMNRARSTAAGQPGDGLTADDWTRLAVLTSFATPLPHAQAAALPLRRRAMEDSWADVLVNRRWQHLAGLLNAADCERLLQRASQRDLVVGGGRWVSCDSATEGWALQLEGGLTAAHRPAVGPRRADPPARAAGASAAQQRQLTT
ncbi:MAG: hypothetical protein EBY28_18460 [Betaproteobacteria bacterium]|nr:hypothetical protein [Betaproteobacteria bacterium]